jgi:putative endonuclease
MSQVRQSLGRWGEDKAAEYLVDHGYAILQRNLRTPPGEIDIVTGKEGATIFVEVKTRSNRSFANPEEAVNRRKQAFMLSAAETYFGLHPESPESWQFDVIAITGRPGQKFEIEHFENVLA